jgi:hypothetical protein
VEEVPPEATDGLLVCGAEQDVLGDGATGGLDTVFREGTGERTSDLFAAWDLNSVQAVVEVSAVLGSIRLVVGERSPWEVVGVARIFDFLSFEAFDDLCGAVFAEEVGVVSEAIDDGN